MSNFKIGDKVRCLKADGHPHPLVKNKAYYVSGITVGGTLRLKSIEQHLAYKEERFEKVVSNKRRR